MKLTGKIIRVESGSSYVDKQQRITVKIAGAGAMSFNNSLEIVNENDWKLDDEIELFAFKKATEKDIEFMAVELAKEDIP